MTLIIIGIVLIVLSVVGALVNMFTGIFGDRSAEGFAAGHGVAIIGNVIGWALVAIGVLLLVV